MVYLKSSTCRGVGWSKPSREDSREDQPNYRQSNREMEEDKVKFKPWTQDTGYGGSVSHTPSEHATEEATKDPQKKTCLVSVKTITFKITNSELVSIPSLSPLPSQGNEPDPLPSSPFNITSGLSQEVLEVKEEETQPTGQELALPSASKMYHSPCSQPTHTPSCFSIEETDADSGGKPFLVYNEFNKEGWSLNETSYQEACLSSQASSNEKHSQSNSLEKPDDCHIITFDVPSTYEGPNFKYFYDQYGPKACYPDR